MVSFVFFSPWVILILETKIKVAVAHIQTDVYSVEVCIVEFYAGLVYIFFNQHNNKLTIIYTSKKQGSSCLWE